MCLALYWHAYVYSQGFGWAIDGCRVCTRMVLSMHSEWSEHTLGWSLVHTWRGQNIRSGRSEHAFACYRPCSLYPRNVRSSPREHTVCGIGMHVLIPENTRSVPSECPFPPPGTDGQSLWNGHYTQMVRTSRPLRPANPLTHTAIPSVIFKSYHRQFVGTSQ